MKCLTLVALSAWCVACSHRSEIVPITKVTPKLDGELGEADWSTRALRHVFTGPDGTQARPFSEIRFLHDAHALYVGLYAADENIQSTEFFVVDLGGLAFRANATGSVTPSIAGLAVSLDRDGTLDDPANDDEEWVLEIAVPIAAVTSGTWKASRCDRTKDGVQRCGSWSARVALE